MRTSRGADYYREAAQAIGKPVKVLFMPADWIIKQDPARFGLLREITQFHGAYSSEKAKHDCRSFVADISLSKGEADAGGIRRRTNGGRLMAMSSAVMVRKASSLGVEPIEL